MKPKSVRSLIATLLLLSALTITLANYATPPLPPPLPKVQAASLTVALSSSTGVAGNVITFTTGATGTSPDGTACSVSGAPSNVVTNFQGQEFGLTAYGSFVVGTGPSGPGGAGYTLTITCGSDSGPATFTVQPSLTVTPPIGMQHTIVAVTVNGFPSDAVGPCTITGVPVVQNPPQSCTISGGTASGTFIASTAGTNGTAYPITVTVVGGTITGSTPTSKFEPVTGNDNGHPNQVPTAIMSLTHAPPSYGTSDGQITITGGGFHLGGTRTCTLTATGVAPPLFSVSSPPCSINANGTLTASFAVSTTPGTGPFTITVVDNSGLTAGTSGCNTAPGCNPFSTTFSLDSSPGTLTLPHTDAIAGTWVQITGPSGNFAPSDAGGCTISPNPLGLFSSSFCAINNSGKILLATFQVSATVPSQGYTLTVTGSHGDPSSPFSSFTPDPVVTSPSPAQGSPPLGALPGTTVTLTGTGFKPTDTGCSITSGAGLFVSGLVCSVNGATGALSASFVVGANSLWGSYSLTVKGTPANDFATNTPSFSVVARIILSPTFGPAGTVVAISGSGFENGGGANCQSVTDGVGGALVGAYSCIDSATGTVSGSFTVGSSPPLGSYTITVTGKTVSQDVASTSFTKGPVVVFTPTITLSTSSGPAGTTVTVTGSGFNPSDAGSCAPITSAPSPDIVTLSSCTISSSGQLISASFTVSSSAAQGVHTIKVTGSTGDSAVATFLVTTSSPSMILSPNSGPVGTGVTITGGGFNPADAGSCVPVTSIPLPDIVTLSSCSISGSGQLSASFTVSTTAAPGAHTIKVAGSSGDLALATFTVTTVTARITITPAAGPSGITVGVTASGFSSSDTSLTFLVSPATLTMSTTSCVISPIGSGGCTFTATISGSPQGYTISAIGNVAGDTAPATFILSSTPSSISVSPTSGPSGTLISVSGTIPVTAQGSPPTGYTSCTITGGSGSGISISTSSCQIISFTAAASSPPLPAYSTFAGSFIVGNQAPGTYTVRVYGSGASSPSGYANYVEATFILTGPKIILNPSSGGRGLSVAVTGSGFSFADNTCSVSSSNGNLIQNNACTINGGTGAATGGFIVGSLNPGTYSVRLTGNTGDFAEATFTVVAGPSIKLTPSSGVVGFSVSVTGSGFFLTDSSCSISGTGVTSQACSVNLSSGAPSGSFVVGNVVPGSYTITLSANGGDSAQAVFVVTSVTAGLTLYPSGPVTPGTTVTFTATGLLTPDTGCSLQATPSTIILSSPTCRISSTGVATGSFVVGNFATADRNPWTIQVVGSPGGDVVSGSLSIIPVIYVTPASGTVGTQFSFTGLGFSLSATSCTVSVSPGTWSPFNCGVTSNGQVSGSFTAGTGTVAGTYPVTVTDSAGFMAFGFVTIGSPTASITISPNVVTPGSSGGIAGSGFNTQDSSCSITPSIFSASTCSVSGGVVAASFTVSSSTSPGLYVVTITGTQYSDFASNFLAVTAVTTQTSTSTTITTYSFSTITSTTTTSTGISTSFSTTTISTTGISTEVFTQVTVTTVSGLTSTTIVGSSTSTSTLVSTTGTTTTTSTTMTIGAGSVVVQPQVVTANPAAVPDSIGLLALLLVLLPFLLRRLLA